MNQLINFFLDLHNFFSSFGIITLVVFLVLVLICLRLMKPHSKSIKIPTTKPLPQEPTLSPANPNELQAIAGEDLMSTQLDLARAYIEMDEKKIAKTILTHVKQKGNSEQQEEANKLILGL